MKTVVLSLIALFSFSILIAQDKPVELEDVEVRAKNSHYISSMQDEYTPNHAVKMQNRAATYDLIHSELYRGGTKSEYFIEFKSDKGSMYTTYDKTGEITKSRENYRDIALPVEVRDEILKDNIGWELKGTEYATLYKDEAVYKKVYKITLKKGKDRKIMIIDLR
ncbi:hypothetical protein E7Z59_09380 [Robertkochia marina]|uniref:Nicotinate-nucleotide adenylyltransferase n=1 Tax=Robertkochia marina TaxID=1227945 RepID=A0A4S3M0I6_9FLAO|nr:hypothetical protein [Robertkochia marina]THD67851.1 hypothetical protein E7Z59_09380 [Robertkochia marina]TRZ42110.1 hypothetical protein D3A96_12335 [Robertkochia marina]